MPSGLSLHDASRGVRREAMQKRHSCCCASSQIARASLTYCRTKWTHIPKPSANCVVVLTKGFITIFGASNTLHPTFDGPPIWVPSRHKSFELIFTYLNTRLLHDSWTTTCAWTTWWIGIHGTLNVDSFWAIEKVVPSKTASWNYLSNILRQRESAMQHKASPTKIRSVLTLESSQNKSHMCSIAWFGQFVIVHASNADQVAWVSSTWCLCNIKKESE